MECEHCSGSGRMINIGEADKTEICEFCNGTGQIQHIIEPPERGINQNKLTEIISHHGFWEFEKAHRGVFGRAPEVIWKIGIEFGNATVTWFEGKTKADVINTAYDFIQKQ